MNSSELKKNWILLASHRPEKDPRIGWIRAHAPADIAINCVAVDHDIEKFRFETDQNGIELTIPYRMEPRNENWVSELCINKRDSIAAKIYLWLGHFRKKNLYSTLAVFKENDLKNRSSHLFHQLLNIRELTERLVGVTSRIDGVCGVIAADFDTLLSASILKEILNVPVVYDAHEYRSEEDHHAGIFEKNIFKDIERQLLNYTDARFIVSDGLRDLATHELGHEFKTLPNAIPLSQQSFKRSEKVDNNHNFIFLGCMAEGRGLEKLIENWRYTEPNCILHLQGPDSSFKERLKQLAKETGLLESRVFFLNSAPEKELMDALNGYEIGIIPYEPVCINNKFCCPNKLSQYMASGLAILANDTEYVKSLLKKYECGLMVDFNDKELFLHTVKLLVLKENLEQMQVNAKNAHLRFYNWECASQVFYKKLAQFSCNNKILNNFNNFENIFNDLKLQSENIKQITFINSFLLKIIEMLKILYAKIIPFKMRSYLWNLVFASLKR